MSAYTTLHYTRKEAIDYVISRIGETSPRELESIMDTLLDKSLYNCVLTDWWDNDKPEETVTLTYKEIFKRVSNGSFLSDMGINEWRISEGGDPYETKTLTKTNALLFMGEEEFEARKNEH